MIISTGGGGDQFPTGGGSRKRGWIGGGKTHPQSIAMPSLKQPKMAKEKVMWGPEQNLSAQRGKK
jgi:hypothetical protein